MNRRTAILGAAAGLGLADGAAGQPAGPVSAAAMERISRSILAQGPRRR